MGSQVWCDINDEAIRNVLMDESDTLLNLDDFFQEETVEEDVYEDRDVVQVEPAEADVEMAASEGVSQHVEENSLDEGGAAEQGGADLNQENIHLYFIYISDSEDSDYESDLDSHDASDSDSDYGFRTHEINAEGICDRCHLEMPQNQLCN